MEISIVKLKNTVDNLLNWVRSDISNHSGDITKSWLYDTFYEIKIGDINFYEQLKLLVTKGDEDNRKLETRLMFERERANLPTFHIHYPQEDSNSGDNTLNTGSLNLVEGNYYSKSFIGQYDIIVTAGNSIECVMLYEFMDALLMAAADTLSYNFDIFKFSGKQLAINNDIIPNLTFYRAIGISLQAKKTVRSLVSNEIISAINFNDTFYEESN